MHSNYEVHGIYYNATITHTSANWGLYCQHLKITQLEEREGGGGGNSIFLMQLSNYSVKYNWDVAVERESVHHYHPHEPMPARHLGLLCLHITRGGIKIFSSYIE